MMWLNMWQTQGGDAAAHAAAGSDLRGISIYTAANIPELHVLATTIVDYAGHRIVAQAIVPGMLDIHTLHTHTHTHTNTQTYT